MPENMTVDIGEKTGAQVGSVVSASDVLYKVMPATYATYRAMRKDPTIAMVRALVSATVLAGEWSVEADDEVDDDMIKEIIDALVKWRTTVIGHAIMGTTDFGWAPFEVVYDLKDGRTTILKIKPLLQDMTTVLVEEGTGARCGYRQKSVGGDTIDLNLQYVLHIAFRVEGTDWYGASLLENARLTHEKWVEADAGAARYDKKIAGAHFHITYPIGESPYNDVMTDNAVIAKALLRTLESSGSIMTPDQLNEEGLPDDARPRWKIEILEDKSARQPSFVDRLKYLDAQKVRALLVPERAVTEGSFGTKAEAETHASAAITNLQIADGDIAVAVNEQIVDKLLEANYGTDAIGTVRIVPAPLTKDKLQQLRELYDKILTNPQGFMEEFGQIDTDALKDLLGVPKRTEVAQAGDDEENIELPPEGATAEELSLVAGLIPRAKGGSWTYEGVGLVQAFGPQLAFADDAFRKAKRLADKGLFDEARMLLFSIPRPADSKAHLAIQRRLSQTLTRFVRQEVGLKRS